MNTNRYGRAKNYNILLEKYINKIQGRRSHRNNTNYNYNSGNNNREYVRGRGYPLYAR